MKLFAIFEAKTACGCDVVVDVVKVVHEVVVAGSSADISSQL